MDGMLDPGRHVAGHHQALQRGINKAISAPDMRKRMIENGYEPVAESRKN